MARNPRPRSASTLGARLCVLALLGPGAAAGQDADPREAAAHHLEQAQIHLDAERYPLVVKELELALALEPDTPGAYYQLGLGHWNLGNLQAAREAFGRELTYGSPDAFSLYYLGRISLNEGNTAAAVDQFERALAIGPVLDVERRLASGYLRLDRAEDAVRLLEQSAAKRPEQGDTHYLLGRAYQRLGHTDEARRQFDLAERWKNKVQGEIRDLISLRVLLQERQNIQAVAKVRSLVQSGDPELQLSTAVILGEHGFHGEALPILRQVLQAWPRSPEAYYNMALAEVSLQRPDSAVPLLAKAVELRPELYEGRVLLGNLLAQAGDGEGAIPHLRAAMAIRPGNAKLAAFLGLQYLQGRYYEQAVDILRTARDLDPKNADLRFVLVNAHFRNHDFELALEEALAAAEAFPDLPNSHFQVAWQLENMGRFEEAQGHLERALALDAHFGEARRLLGEIVLRLGDAEGSLVHFREAIEMDRESGQAYAGLGKALLQLKKYDEAVREMTAAVAVDPKLAPLRLHLSQAFRALGRMEEARREAATFSDLNKARAQQRDRDVERIYRPGEVRPGR